MERRCPVTLLAETEGFDAGVSKFWTVELDSGGVNHLPRHTRARHSLSPFKPGVTIGALVRSDAELGIEF